MVITGTLDNTNATFSVNASEGQINLNQGSTIKGGRIAFSDNTLFATALSGSSVLDGVTLDGNANSSPVLLIRNTVTFQNTCVLDHADLELGISLQSSSLVLDSTSPLAGTGTVFLRYTSKISSNAPGGLVIPDGIAIRGTLPANGSNSTFHQIVGVATAPVINNGLISAEAVGLDTGLRIFATELINNSTIQFLSGTSLIVAGTLTNNGLITANAATLDLSISNFSIAMLSTIPHAGGLINITTAYDNTDNSIALNAATGDFGIDSGAIITGGTITATDGARFHLASGATGNLVGVTLAADAFAHDGSNVHILNSLTLSNDLFTIGTPGSGVITNLTFNGNASLNGAGELLLTSNVAGFGPNVGGSLAIGPGITVLYTGAGTIGQNGGNGTSSILNQGVILAQGRTKTVSINGGFFSNQGTITSSGGSNISLSNVTNTTIGLISSNAAGLTFPANETFTNAGTISATSATVTFAGTVNNSGNMDFHQSTIDFTSASGSLQGSLNFDQSTVYTIGPAALNASAAVTRNGGTVVLTAAYTPGAPAFDLATVPLWGPLILGNGAALSNLTLSNSGGDISVTNVPFRSGAASQLTNVVLATNLDIGTASTLTAFNNLALDGVSITLNGLSGGLSTSNLQFANTQDLTGTGVVEADGSGTGIQNAIALSAGTLTIEPDIIIRTGTGSLALNALATGAAILNKGTILAQNGRTISINANGFTNQGTIQVEPGSSLTISQTLLNNGQIIANNASLSLVPLDSLSSGGFADSLIPPSISPAPGHLPNIWRFRSRATLSSCLHPVPSTWAVARSLLIPLITTFLSSGGTLTGGTVAADPGAALFVSGTAAFNNLSLLAPLLITGTTLTLTGAFSTNNLITLSNAKVTFNSTSQSATTITGTGTVSIGSASIPNSVISDGITVTSLVLGANALYTIRPNTGGASILAGTSKISTLTLARDINVWGAKLDITNNTLIIQATDPTDKANKIATLQNQIAQAAAGGTWTGTGGITSSTVAADSTHALGLALADNLTLEYTTFAGQSVDANSIIITAAHVGDSTLDGKVDIQDLNNVVAHWQHTGLLWSDGDTTGPQGIPDGNVDIQDLNAVVANWQVNFGSGLTPDSTSLSPQSSALSPSPVPEPATLALLTLAVPTLLRRRKPGPPSSNP